MFETTRKTFVFTSFKPYLIYLPKAAFIWVKLKKAIEYHVF